MLHEEAFQANSKKQLIQWCKERQLNTVGEAVYMPVSIALQLCCKEANSWHAGHYCMHVCTAQMHGLCMHQQQMSMHCSWK